MYNHCVIIDIKNIYQLPAHQSNSKHIVSSMDTDKEKEWKERYSTEL